MPRQPIPLSMGEAPAASRFVSPQSLVNCYVEQHAETGRTAIYGGPGLALFATAGSGPIRGLLKFSSIVWCVSGNRVYYITAAGAAIALSGTISNFANAPVYMACSTTQMVIVSDTVGYVVQFAGVWTLTQITDPDWPGGGTVAWLDGYFIFTGTGSQFYISALGDATSYDALDYASAEARPDRNLRAIVDRRDLYIIGTDTIEGYTNTGAADFPFERSYEFVNYGIAESNASAVTFIDNTLVFLSSDLQIRTLRSAASEVISDHAIAEELRNWTPRTTVTRAFSHSVRGHAFATFRNAAGCVQWDAATRKWSRRKSYGYNTWNVGCSVDAYGEQFVGSTLDGKIFRLDPNVYAEGSDPLVRELVTSALSPGGASFTVDSIEIEVEPGVGLVSGQGSDPKLWLQISKDFGNTWSSRIERSIGARGVRNVRCVWNGLGQFQPQGGVIKIGCSDPVPLCITQAWADVTPDR